ncbi:hypothetical protein LU699_18220 [Luteimonas fraxinea]|uniref:hypothetical protein n=1 Tax=Luteimonas fraxinea TaxID=2901869 RepID=UPI001E5B79D1|nr:hypothetical protein [Luteimonas fraxinea]UHH10160.1 hypothetical protein LU699_18220 [Luteimonas fraxinea]
MRDVLRQQHRPAAMCAARLQSVVLRSSHLALADGERLRLLHATIRNQLHDAGISSTFVLLLEPALVVVVDAITIARTSSPFAIARLPKVGVSGHFIRMDALPNQLGFSDKRIEAGFHRPDCLMDEVMGITELIVLQQVLGDLLELLQLRFSNTGRDAPGTMTELVGIVEIPPNLRLLRWRHRRCAVCTHSRHQTVVDMPLGLCRNCFVVVQPDGQANCGALPSFFSHGLGHMRCFRTTALTRADPSAFRCGDAKPPIAMRARPPEFPSAAVGL